ncbi:hypothetical protein PAI11_44130 [Patulibacter medicamentivorans]|uniref:Uncharacterized protein n=1 Tax=Patulibacter medicamentivorans TaxID=1097667 RepID=H0EC28_9ACTN|nr:hypothetical protein [Patulibacter medicamentivorans]EHN08764.1 hypothetical protein PAI11_44130 [Patulibacter medicamentivorans]
MSEPVDYDHERRLLERRRLAQAPLDEAGEGQSEGFELAERDLIDHASHGDGHNTQPIIRDGRAEAERDLGADTYGEADQERPCDLGREG